MRALDYFRRSKWINFYTNRRPQINLFFLRQNKTTKKREIIREDEQILYDTINWWAAVNFVGKIELKKWQMWSMAKLITYFRNIRLQLKWSLIKAMKNDQVSRAWIERYG